MASTQDERLEEIVWRAPEIVQNMGGIHTNTGMYTCVQAMGSATRSLFAVLFYFAESPFFERTSNNASLYAQALNNQSIFYIITERRFFEERLRSMQGLEYMVTQDPSEGDKKQVHSGVWVIRKQNRRKRTGLSDEVTPLANYFIVGESIYMAPSLGAILSTRLVHLFQLSRRRDCADNHASYPFSPPSPSFTQPLAPYPSSVLLPVTRTCLPHQLPSTPLPHPHQASKPPTRANPAPQSQAPHPNP